LRQRRRLQRQRRLHQLRRNLRLLLPLVVAAARAI
jgi:hypothetical protein